MFPLDCLPTLFGFYEDNVTICLYVPKIFYPKSYEFCYRFLNWKTNGTS